MIADITRWFEYGEPIDNDRVEAQIITTYSDRSPREIQHGTLDIEMLGLMETHDEIQRHIHEDGSLCLSTLPIPVEEEFLESFEPTESEIELLYRGGPIRVPEFSPDMERQIQNWIAHWDFSPSMAIDYYFVERNDWSQKDWAEQRGVSQQAVSDNIRRARELLNS